MCPFNYQTCRQYLGQMVEVRHKRGVHRGIVEQVTNTGIYLRPMDFVSAPIDLDKNILNADQGNSNIDAENVFFFGGFSPFGRFFVPFLSILALSTLLFW
jgi:hypothetical protein